jgi:hypothetical protein
MKRLLNICLFLLFLIGYLEWGKGHHAFIIQMESEIFLKAKNDLKSILHPLILIPFCGQILLIITFFQKEVSRILSLTGLTCLSLFILLLLFVGLISLNIRIVGSTLPFIITAIFVLKYNWRKRSS